MSSQSMLLNSLILIEVYVVKLAALYFSLASIFSTQLLVSRLTVSRDNINLFQFLQDSQFLIYELGLITFKSFSLNWSTSVEIIRFTDYLIVECFKL